MASPKLLPFQPWPGMKGAKPKMGQYIIGYETKAISPAQEDVGDAVCLDLLGQYYQGRP